MAEGMKPSGTDYLLDIPNSWDVKRFKYCAQICNGGEYSEIEVDEGGYPVIGSGGEFARASRYCYDGESVLLGRKGTIDKPIYINGAFWCVDTMFYTKIPNTMNAKYLYYCALCFRFDYYVTSTALPSMTQKDLGSEMVAVPNYFEQYAIVDYLDEQCAKIDSIIADIEKQIELLKQYKKSLITETVTKGLDKTAPMKDSGIEWIGQIPEHWSTKRLKFLLEKNSDNMKVGPFGSSLAGSDFTDEGKWVYNQRMVLDDCFSDNDTFVSEEKYNELKAFRVQEGDLLITTRGTIGKIAIVPTGAEDGILHPCIIRFRIDSEKMIPELVKLIFNESDYAKDQFVLMSNATTIDVIYSYSLKDILLPVIPLSEQHSILDYLQKKCDSTNQVMQEKRVMLNLLRQHKKSLIYEYVTGKKRVKEAM